MTKAKSKTAKPAKAAKPKRKAKVKPTPEQISDQDRQRLLFQHKRKIAPLVLAKDNAGKALTKAYELAKKEGITKKEIEVSLKLDTDEGIEAIRAEVERTQRVARWMGLADQLDMFGQKQTNAERLYEDGKRAAFNDQPAKPPEHLSGKDAQIWLDGHAAGRTSLNTARAGEFKSLGEAAAGVTDKVTPGPIGTEEPTHRVAA